MFYKQYVFFLISNVTICFRILFGLFLAMFLLDGEWERKVDAQIVQVTK